MEDFGVSQDVIEELENSADAEAQDAYDFAELSFQTQIKSMTLFMSINFDDVKYNSICVKILKAQCICNNYIKRKLWQPYK